MKLQDLIKLIYYNDIPELKNQKSQGVDFTITDPQNQNNILIAYSGYGYDEKYTQKEMVRFLIECGLDVNAQRNGRGSNLSALHMAVANGFIDIIEVLIENGADVEVKDKNGNTPLWNAVMNYRGRDGELEIIKCLLSNGSSLDTKNNHDNSPRDIIVETRSGIDDDLNQKEWDLSFLLKEN